MTGFPDFHLPFVNNNAKRNGNEALICEFFKRPSETPHALRNVTPEKWVDPAEEGGGGAEKEGKEGRGW